MIIMAITNKNSQGMVLILSILIIASVLGAAVAFGNIIISEIRQSRLIDQSIQSYYLAESGSEKALHRIRRQEAISDCSLDSAGVCQENGYCSSKNIPCVYLTGSLPAKGNWDLEISEEFAVSILLNKGESFQVDLFNPVQAYNSNINEIKIESSIVAPILVGEFLNLTNILNFNDPQLSNCFIQPAIFKNFLPTMTTIPTFAYVSSLDGQILYNECSYAFRLNHSLKSAVDFSLFTITVYNSTPSETRTQLPIPSRLIVDSQATFGRSFQKIRVKTPIRAPLSGLYDFVLFSEEEVVK